MKFQQLGIQGAWLVESEVFEDARGSFREWFKSEEIKSATGFDFSVAQANTSTSNKGAIRGIHYSLAPEGQVKWVTCTTGRVLDVIVDIRPDSPTFKEVEYIELNCTEARAILIGAGLGHGFLALEENSSVSYLLSSRYAPEFEFGIQPFDPILSIDWRLDSIGGNRFLISPKDVNAPELMQRKSDNLLPNLRKINSN